MIREEERNVLGEVVSRTYTMDSDEFKVKAKLEKNKSIESGKKLDPEAIYNVMKTGIKGVYLVTKVDLRPVYSRDDTFRAQDRSTSKLCDADGNLITGVLEGLRGLNDDALADMLHDDKKKFTNKLYDELAAYMGKSIDKVDRIPVEFFKRKSLSNNIIKEAKKEYAERIVDDEELKKTVEAAIDTLAQKEEAYRQQQAAKEEAKNIFKTKTYEQE